MNLKELRISQKLKQNEMALKIGVSASYYYKIESGTKEPSFEFLKKLKLKFPNISVDELYFSK